MRASFLPVCPLCWAITGAAACKSSPAAVKIENVFRGIPIFMFLRTGNAPALLRAKCRRINPFERGWVAYRNRLPRDDVCAKRPAHTTADVQPSPQHTRGEIEPGPDCEVTAPLPSSKNAAPCAFGNKPSVLAEGQIVNPVSREFVPLIEA